MEILTPLSTIQGTHGFEKHLDRSISLSRYLADRIRAREGFELVLEVSPIPILNSNPPKLQSQVLFHFHSMFLTQEPEYTSVPFWYVPPSLRSCTDPAERQQRLAKVAPLIKAGMIRAGKFTAVFLIHGSSYAWIKPTDNILPC